MQWEDYRQSENLEDRRGSGGGFAGMPGGRGGVGIGTMVVLGLLGWALGIDPRLLIGGAELIGGIGGRPQTQETRRSSGPPQDEMGRFVSAVLAQNEDIWSKILPQQANIRYQPPRLVLFSGVDRSGCGTAQAAMGPFYCPADKKVYLDTSFFQEMQRKLGGGGDFAYAYVVGHEVGHHIQNLLGILPKANQIRERSSERDANAISVRIELQADCFAGVWAHNIQAMGRLDQGDIEEALRSAAAIGDDKLQQASQGVVVPDSFTHGSSAQRTKWFNVGFQSGSMQRCDTFRNPV
ncbi:MULTISPECIES: neutral zinc metallopeptidase [Bosea]|uniref:KPN_02809 family neutral zinc metallopeptidase n=1 Tax=Bosea TaxID=85413 RepID=UPI00214FDA9F|nr:MULTISPECIES: neutral zinc metallopeptidase [Bosea]MCR4521339.1 zinc metallopeptidase [Bosea sp. 47.2.35]MDR6826763.1 putative metalloprotease [Bosea robiniae]MDR6893473.1 putative metalloprotease [Bosea sp. BE109]MDR7136828.1 putative metalloprotease [Bosea sp. BE168]MDR7173527.1 putative metalloprotease [Bosea sp. BE271]